MESLNRQRGGVVAIVRASCPTCGDVEMTIHDVQVLLCSDTNEGSYAFRCPACGVAVSKPIDAGVIDVLIASGANLSVWELPSELQEPHLGAPITYDDLLEFHFRLEREDWRQHLLGSAS